MAEIRFAVSLDFDCLKGAFPKCSRCGAEVVWHKTTKGSNMPLEWKTRKPSVDKDMWLLESHFAHCPHAGHFRGRKRRD